MKVRSRSITPLKLLLAAALCQGASFNALAVSAPPRCQLLIVNQLFDGVNFPQANMAVLVEGNTIKQIGSPDQLRGLCKNRITLGDATLLPGFIESHAHVTFQNVNKNTVLEHGITTVQDTGGPLMVPEGGQGSLRLLSTGPIIQAEGGYPLNIFGGGTGGFDKIGYPISANSTEAEVKAIVQHLVDGGATAIKIALELGGEMGAPWMQPHEGPVPPAPWTMLSLEQAQWIVAQAHLNDRRVIVHAGENIGFEQALDAGVDEFAHMPCAEISDSLLQRAVEQGVTFVTTIDTLSSCVNSTTFKGIHSNTI